MGEGVRASDHNGALVARHWTVDEWSRSQVAWDRLVAHSSADPLFLSWGWLTHWWQCYGQALGLPPKIVAFYRDDRLVGLAPLYYRQVRRGAVVHVGSVQMIGLSWRDPEPLISEYLDVIALPDHLDAVRDACLTLLMEQPGWQELVFGLSTSVTQWREAITGRTGGKYYLRELDRSTSYQADLAGGFGQYLRDLGQSTRRSVWNLRRRLTEHGAVRLEHAGADEISGTFGELNRLHSLRWKRPAFAGKRLSFHIDLARRLSEGGELALTRLRVNRRRRIRPLRPPQREPPIQHQDGL